MAFIHIPKGWQLPEGEVTSEDIYMNRRRFMQAMGVAGRERGDWCGLRDGRR